MEPVSPQRRGAGAGFVGVGLAFVAIGTTAPQPALLGVGVAFLGLGIGRLLGRGKAR
ncbi:hypothetical protein [Pseudoxanthomonas sp. 10H]|uniref:hypothetical protein n=1 Tax=Pseudoxanthomonas sp. 10H TaxID=3242729 RepID=UPI003558E549